jgi:hypothetical protein
MLSRPKWPVVTVCRLAFFFALSGGLNSAAAQSCLAIIPANYTINFGKIAVGTTTLTQDVEVTNLCTPTVQVSSFSMSSTEFKLQGGWAPITLAQGQNMIFLIRFAPDAPQTFTGTATVNVDGYSPIVVTMSGSGFLADATPSWSSSALAFSSVPLGTTSAAQTVTLTNTGTKGVTVTNVYTDAPFSVTGFTVNQNLRAGGSLPLQVTFAPSATGSFNGTLVVTTNNLPPTGVTLSGTAITPTLLAITNFPTLPVVTQGAAYLAALHSINGVGTVTWSVAPGSTLPSGLRLSAAGGISGTLGATVPVGNYLFSVKATDSSANTITQQFTLPIQKPTGANCNNIDWDVTGTKIPMVPLTDLGTGTYQGSEGGLYPNGSNVMPDSHDADGVAFAQSIQPLDANGNVDPNGKYGLISMGMSVTFDTFLKFMADAGADPSTNKSLVFVPAAQPRLGAVDWADITGPAWTDTFNYFLPQSGLTPQQVVAAWVESVDANPHGSFPGDMAVLQSEYETAAQLLHTEFPNLKLVFFSSREYGAYENGLPHGGDKEPFAYESAFAVRGMIQDQLNGLPAMNYDAANGPVVAPWVAWGPYIWADGLIQRGDGLVWPCYYFEPDGQHPSSKTGGSEQDANMLLNFMKTNDATAPWFLAH